jgi:DNA (cytosine-5)-methyltransferase 1
VQVDLAQAVKRWSTPAADDTGHRASKYNQGGTALSTQVGGALNPTWVEWLMGWPLGWTDLEPLETAKCHSARQPHGRCSLELNHENPDFHTTIRE